MNTHADTDRLYVADEDISDTRRPTPDQARAINLLELNPGGLQVVRLSLGQWRHVNRVVGALAALGVPPPRVAADDHPSPTTEKAST